MVVRIWQLQYGGNFHIFDLDSVRKWLLDSNSSYLLVGIDIFTRYGFAIPIKSKNADDTLEAFKKLLQQAKTYPSTVFSDRGNK